MSRLGGSEVAGLEEAEESGGGEGGLSDLEGENGNKSPPPANSIRNRHASPMLQDSSGPLSWNIPQLDGTQVKHELEGFENRMGPKVLPFEFCALEVCLEAACSALDSEVFFWALIGKQQLKY